MINKIRKAIELQKELEKEHNIISIRDDLGGYAVHMYKLEDFLNVSNGNEYLVYRNSEDVPYQLNYEEDNLIFIVLLTAKEYEDYKKATAPTVTDES